jgi:hypothetical protein
MFHTYHPVLQYHKNSCLSPSTIRHAIVYESVWIENVYEKKREIERRRENTETVVLNLFERNE